MTLTSIGQSCKRGATSFIECLTAVLSTTEGLDKISTLSLSIFELIEKVHSSLPTSLASLGSALQGFGEITTLISLAKRVKNLFFPDDKGQMIWQRSWRSIGGTLSLSGLTFTSFCGLLHSHQIINLGKRLATFNVINTACSIVSATFDIWEAASAIITNKTKKIKASHAKETWNRYIEGFNSREEWQKIADDKIGEWEAKRKNLNDQGNINKTQQAHSKIGQWTQLKNCPDSEMLKNYCLEKVNKWTCIETNCKNEIKKSWVTLANSIANVVLTVLGLVLPVARISALAISLLVFTVSSNALDLSHYILDHFVIPTIPIAPVHLKLF